MYLSILLLPLISIIGAGLFGFALGPMSIGIISSILLTITAILSTIAFVNVVIYGQQIIIDIAPWFLLESMDVNYGLLFDSLSVSMLIPVTYISAAVLTYTVYYMNHDPHHTRFTCYISLFTFFMAVLVTGNNFLIMFIGWEGIGVSSYLLINFWFTSNEANQSGMSALLVNRIGDIFVTVYLALLYFVYGGVGFSQLHTLTIHKDTTILHIIGLMLVIGSLAKSAQMPFTKWLPESMIAPTPTSSLLHAATLVTAGVYILLRSSPIIEPQDTLLLLIMFIGSVTSLLAGFIGLFQYDIKRIIAYSTVAQIGMCFMAIGLSQFNLSLYHLINHSMYKALLFLCAGVIIHSANDLQDIRKMGGLKDQLPFAYSTMLIASLSLAAIPGLSGYYSKDLIIETSWGLFTVYHTMAYWLSAISAIATAMYSFNILYKVFLQEPQNEINFYKNSAQHGIQYNYTEWFMLIPLIMLTIMSIFIGYILYEPLVGYGTNAFDNVLPTLHNSYLDLEFQLPNPIKLLPLIGGLFMILLLTYIFEFTPPKGTFIYNNKIILNIYTFFNQRLFHNILYNRPFTAMPLYIGYILFNNLDKGAFNIIGPHGIWNSILETKASTTKINIIKVTAFPLIVALIILIMPIVNISSLAILLIATILYTLTYSLVKLV